jgi:acyl-CoA oxidase
MTGQVDSGALQQLLDGRYAQLRNQMREVLARPEFAPVLGLATGEYRQRVLQWAQTLAAEGLTAPGFPSEFGGADEPGANVAAFETLGFGDLSLLIKFGVQFGCGVAPSSNLVPAGTMSATSPRSPALSSPAASR